MTEIDPPRYLPHAPIVIAGTPRSGTTWLQRMICSDHAYQPLFESFNPRRIPKSAYWSSGYVKASRSHKHLRLFIDQLLAGESQNSWMNSRQILQVRLSIERVFRLARPKKESAAERVPVIKTVRGNLMLSWLVRTYSVRTFLLIRRSSDVINSIIGFGWFPEIIGRGSTAFIEQLDLVKNHLSDHYGWLSELTQIRDCLAARWAIENLVPIRELSANDLTVLTSEQLTAMSPSALRAMLIENGLQTQPSDQAIGKPSSSAVPRTRNVAASQSSLQAIVSKLGMDIYTKEGARNPNWVFSEKWHLGNWLAIK